MRILLFSGLLYLTGIAAILFLRPSLMFNENGTWKEFGIGRGERYTWLPFWLFAITWAMMSYIIVWSLSGAVVAAPSVATQSVAPAPEPLLQKRLRVSRSQPLPVPRQELMPGYYMLNTPAINERGVPRYVYIGDTLPSNSADL